ncbi:hypothetical protein [Ornithinimicrobium kibberense]
MVRLQARASRWARSVMLLPEATVGPRRHAHRGLAAEPAHRVSDRGTVCG